MAVSTGEIGNRLRQAREDRGLSQRALSEKTGLTQAMISKIESGAVDPRLSTLTTLARAVGLELALVPPFARSALSAMIGGAHGPAALTTEDQRPAYSLDDEPGDD